MEPISAVEEASEEEMGEKMEGVVTTEAAMKSVVRLLQDCLLPDNSAAIQSGALLSLKHLICLRQLYGESRVPEHLFRLARESDYTHIREQALSMLGWMTGHWCDMFLKDPEYPPTTAWNLDFMPLLTDLVRKYADIQEPTDLFSLNNAIEALTQVALKMKLLDTETLRAQMLEILPAVIGIFKETGKRKSAQIQAGEFLAIAMSRLDGNDLLESGMIEMLLEMLRMGKESSAILIKALRVLNGFLKTRYYRHNTGGVNQKVLDMGILDAIHQVLKRPNDSFKRKHLWDKALRCLARLSVCTAEHGEAILNEGGLIESVLEMALGMDMSQEKFHTETSTLLNKLSSLEAHSGQASQVRRLLLSGPLFPLLSRYLNETYDELCFNYELSWNLSTLKACLKLPGSVTDKRIVGRLIDNTGITDALRRISISEPDSDTDDDCADLARDILDTCLSDPLPPTPPNNLPTIIYTRNAPS